MQLGFDDLRVLIKVMQESMQEVITLTNRLMVVDAEMRDLRRKVEVLESQMVHTPSPVVQYPTYTSET